MKILGISGSLRRDSHNTKLLRAAGELLPDDVEFELWDGLKAVPPYDEDDEVGVAPAAVAELREAIAGADAILFATPEYNSSIPGAAEERHRLGSRGRWPTARAAATSPSAVIGASTGMFGAVWAQAELRKVLASAGARVLDGELPVPVAAHALRRGRVAWSTRRPMSAWTRSFESLAAAAAAPTVEPERAA